MQDCKYSYFVDLVLGHPFLFTPRLQAAQADNKVTLV